MELVPMFVFARICRQSPIDDCFPGLVAPIFFLLFLQSGMRRNAGSEQKMEVLCSNQLS